MNRAIFAAMIVGVAIIAFPPVARADALLDAAVQTELAYQATKINADRARSALTPVSDQLINTVSSAPQKTAVKNWCSLSAQTAVAWCPPFKNDNPDADALKVAVKPNGDNYPLAAWCSVDTAAATTCAAFNDKYNALQAALSDLKKSAEARDDARDAYTRSTQNATTFSARIGGARKARCVTAYCWGGGTGDKFAVEPIVELPIGLTWAVGNGALANHINASGIDVRLNAGIRLWFEYDAFSLGILLFQPTLTSSRGVGFPGTDQPLGTDAIRRPYPSLAIGFAGDIFLLTASYDQLRNVTSAGGHDPNFLPDEVLSRTFTFGLYLAPFTTARNGLGAAAGSGQ